jgi:poly(hydroxyalkanoate) depolymerase family esterase
MRRGAAGDAVTSPRFMLRRLATSTLVLLAFAPGVATAAPDPTDPGQTTSATVTSNGTEYPYLLYTPTSYRAGRPAPLMVVVHGCQTTAAQEQKVTLYDKLAERAGFVVLYVDVDALGRTQPGPANQCWKFPYPPAWSRDGSDAAAIADMTRAVMATRAVDPERVYLVGVSAGGLMASIDAAAYPDLYAAVGIVESAGYVDFPCFATGVGIPVTTSAQLAFEQMGPRARIVPIFVIGSNGDLAFPAACANKAIEQGLRTDNLVISGSQDGPIALTPAAVRHEQKPGGDTYTVSSYRDPDGCLIGERTIIDGMPHAWPGGTSDPAYAGYSEPKAPSGAEISWAFFRRYAKRETSMPCAEAAVSKAVAPAPAPLRCRARWLLVRLPAGVRGAGATVNGRRATARKTRGGVRVRLPAGTRARTTIVVRARAGAGRHVMRRRTSRGCS